jgi:ABC-type polar amino acid transport system ATPase subunit
MTSVGSAENGAPLLSMRRIVKNFGALQVLRGVDLDVHKGELVAIIGPSGSGKSTLLRCINRLESPTSGEVVLGGTVIPAQGRELNKVRRHIGMVFQSFNLYPHLTAERNVSLALRKVLKLSSAEASRQAVAALTRVGLASKINAYPVELSGGQQQRVAIARAMAMEPKLYLFDEPTSALDPELVGEVLTVMRGMRSNGQTMVVVTHEMAFARQVADRIVFMDGGKIVEIGSPDHIFEKSTNPRLNQFLRSHREREH